MIVIFINCSLFPFIDWIIKGWKLFETRNRNTLKSFIGKTVYFAETGKHKKPVVRCSCLISSVTIITDKKAYNGLRRYTRIKSGSLYDLKPETVKKCLYRLENVKPCKPFELPDNAIRKCRVYAIVPE